MSNKDDFIELIKIVISNNGNLDHQVNVDKMIRLAGLHGIDCIIMQALKKLNYQLDKNYKNKYNLEMIKSITQDAELDSIIEVFTKAKINFMPLKGCIIKHLYQDSYLRQMADLDILIERNRIKEAGKLLKSLGYKTEAVGGNHDIYHKLPFMNIELHRDLIDESYETSSYYKDVWDRIISNSDNKYHFYFSKEDYYIFMITHYAKHFSRGGTGIKSIIDTYIYLNKYQSKLDFKYIEEEFIKLNLLKFANNLKELALNVFSNSYKIGNNDLDMMLDYILNSGSYGIISNSDVVAGFMNTDEDLKKSKNKYLFRRLFPTFIAMKKRNPILCKIPILLPWFYFTRLLKGLFNFKKIKSMKTTIDNINKEEIEKIKQVHEQSGLYNKEK